MSPSKQMSLGTFAEYRKPYLATQTKDIRKCPS